MDFAMSMWQGCVYGAWPPNSPSVCNVHVAGLFMWWLFAQFTIHVLLGIHTRTEFPEYF